MSSLIPVKDAKAAVVAALARGATVSAAVSAVGRTPSAYEQWRFKDPTFKAEVDQVRAARAAAEDRGAVRTGDPTRVDFATFRREYLGSETYRHQAAWVDVLEGRPYVPVPGERFTEGPARRKVIVNTPPFHAKSSTLTIDYSVYRICMNPNVRIILVSKTQQQAKKFLYAIKKRLTDSRWAKLQATFAPEGGFKGTGAWTQTQIYVGAADSGEKDPTVEALGIGGQIYGARADLIICDDVADVGNAHEFEKQITWLSQDVESRLFDGVLLMVGTRVGPQDVYSELLNPDRYMSGRSPWTHLAQPAVLQFADDPVDWVTLWPKSTQPLDMDSDQEPGPDGLYAAWDGPRLAELRDSKSARIWSLVYQQQDSLGDTATFKPLCVWGSVNRRRRPGPLSAVGMGHPRGGGEGMWTIASMDPAMAGETFTLVGKVNRADQRRYVENAWVKPNPDPDYIRGIIKQVTDEFGVNEWVIEQNAFQLFLTMDPEVNQFLASRGVRLTPHYTSRNKQDPDFGVASVAPLFGSSRKVEQGGREIHVAGSNLLELPDPDYSEGVKALIEELLTWVPGRRGKDLRQDGPMALWFFELRARQILGFGDHSRPAQTHMRVPFMSRGQDRKRAVAPPALRLRRGA